MLGPESHLYPDYYYNIIQVLRISLSTRNAASSETFVDKLMSKRDSDIITQHRDSHLLRDDHALHGEEDWREVRRHGVFSQGAHRGQLKYAMLGQCIITKHDR